MINKEFIAKIEGHGRLKIDWSKNRVKLFVDEGERLFEGILPKRTIEETYWITARICGICPIAHNLASVRACERALGIKENPPTRLLRELLTSAQIIQSHMFHLFFLSLPDYLGIDRGTELATKNPRAFKTALALKEVSDEIARLIGGRNIHPVTTAIGGFNKIPSFKELKKLLQKIQKTKKAAEETLKLCSKLDYPKIEVDFDLIAQQGEFIISSSGEKSLIKNYKKDIEEEVKNHSTAKFGKYKKREVMVGALARLYFSLKDKKIRSMINFKNPFHNNLAQAVEILIYHQKAEKVLKQLLKSDIEKGLAPSYKKYLKRKKRFKGIGTAEAPRGGLYHEFHFNQKGIITYANIITPTVQNLTSIEKSANVLLKTFNNLPRKKIEHLLEMLVRAYDPCITCAVH